MFISWRLFVEQVCGGFYADGSGLIRFATRSACININSAGEMRVDERKRASVINEAKIRRRSLETKFAFHQSVYGSALLSVSQTLRRIRKCIRKEKQVSRQKCRRYVFVYTSSGTNTKPLGCAFFSNARKICFKIKIQRFLIICSEIFHNSW